MPTSRTTHVDRERDTHLQDNIKANPEQLKLSKTDVNMAINSRLLICKV
jgi:hypothetical protein